MGSIHYARYCTSHAFILSQMQPLAQSDGSGGGLSQETGFFRGLGGSWDTPYGDFFLSWYSGALLAHGERLVKTATSIFNTMHPRRCTITNHNNSAQSIVNVGPAYGSPGGLQVLLSAHPLA